MLSHTGKQMRLALFGIFLVALAPAANRNALRDPHSAFWAKHAPETYRVKVETTRGAFVMEVHRAWAPTGADRFYNLVRAGFFDDSRFFRVTARFAQFGIAGAPEIAGVWREVTIPDDPVAHSNARGTFAFAMTGPNARSTQIYICKKDMPEQDAQGFSPLGTIIQGMDTVDALYADYGETAGGGMRGGKQGRIFAEGNTHLDSDIPRHDRLQRARVVK